MQPRDLVNEMLDDRDRFDDQEPRPSYQLVFPIGDEDVDLTVLYSVSKSHQDDSDYVPGGFIVDIDEVTRDDTGEDVWSLLTPDQRDEIYSDTVEHHRQVR